MPTLKFYRKHVYGKVLLYPANKTAKAICDLSGSKTLSDSALRIAEQDLGMKLELVHEDQSEI